MAPLGYLKIFRRRWRVVLACFVIAAVTGYLLSPEESAQPEGSGFQATLTLVPSVEAETGPNLHLAAYLATTQDVATLAAEKLPPDIRPSNAEAITAGVDDDAGALTITAIDPDPTHAGAIAAAYAAATIEFFQTSTTVANDEDALAGAQAQLAAMEERIAELEDGLRENPDDPVLLARLETDLAQYGIIFQRVQDLLGVDQNPVALQVLGSPQVTEIEGSIISAPQDRGARALLAGLLGLLLGLGVAVAVDRFDPRLRERDDVEEALGLPVLAEIPRIKRRARANHALVTAVKPTSAAAEAYRSLRSAITLVAQGRRNDDDGPSARIVQQSHQVLVITGPQGHEGKSTTVVNMAAAFAETDRSVIVIDCDFRKPEAHLFLNVSPRPGLADVMDASLHENADKLIRSTAIPRVSLVTSGKAVSHPASVFPRLAEVIVDARQRADVVLIDSSPLLAVSEAVDVLQYADAALVACRLGRTTDEQARRARELLDRAEVPLLGVVLTGTSPRRGTPYGQLKRSQVLRSVLANWVQSAGQAPSRNGATAEATPEQRVDVAGPDIRQDDGLGEPQENRERRGDQHREEPQELQSMERGRYQRRHERPNRGAAEQQQQPRRRHLDQRPAQWRNDGSTHQQTDAHDQIPDRPPLNQPDQRPNEHPTEQLVPQDERPQEEPDQRPNEHPTEQLAEHQDEPPQEQPDQQSADPHDELATEQPGDRQVKTVSSDGR